MLAGVGGDGAPVVADGAQVGVAVEVVGCQEAVGDAVDEVRRKRGPALRQGLDRPSRFPVVLVCCAQAGRRRGHKGGGVNK